MNNQTYFQDELIDEDKFSSWVAQVHDDNKKAKCKVSKKSLELSNMGRGALTSHQMKSEKYKHLMKNLSAFWLSRSGNLQQTTDMTLLVTNQLMSVVKPMRKISSKPFLKLL